MPSTPPTNRPAPPSRPAAGKDPKLAVALRYDRKNDRAPRITAKGEGDLADAILALAREHGVTIREDGDLARLLSAVELETQVPVEAFVAVAEILSYVYRSRGAPAAPAEG